MAGAFRTVREESQFEREKKKLRSSAKRFDEVLEGITWVLSRKPESFPNVPGTRLHLAKTDAAQDTPGFYVWFTFDDHTVYLLSIEEIPKEL